jgi:hypothetical protein
MLVFLNNGCSFYLTPQFLVVGVLAGVVGGGDAVSDFH